jgi:hypothetical protein
MTNKIISLHGMALLCLPVGVLAQAPRPLVTDRPDFTESTQVVGAGAVQAEAGVTAGWPEGAGTISGPELLLRVGLSRSVELRLGLPSLIRESRSRVATSGAGPASIGLKLELLRGRTAAGFVAGAEVPTGSRPFGDGAVTPAVRLVVAREVGVVSMATMGSAVFDDRVRYEQTVVASHPLGSTMGFFVEYAAGFGGGVEDKHLGHVGIAWRLTDDLQVDVHGGRSLRGDAAPFIGAGLAIRRQ